MYANFLKYLCMKFINWERKGNFNCHLLPWWVHYDQNRVFTTKFFLLAFLII